MSINKSGRVPYNNGHFTKMFIPGEQPEGWVEGWFNAPSAQEEIRKMISATKTGTICYNNGINNIFIKPGDIVPEGYVKGTIYKPTDGYKAYHCGDKVILINPELTPIPEGFEPGGRKMPDDEKAKHNSCGGKVKCSNGIVNKYFFPDKIPEGFKRISKAKV